MGILDPLYWVVSGVMVVIHRALSPIFGETSGVSWTLSIMGLVLLIRTLLIPLFVKQIKSQRALTALSPEMKKIQQKYKDDRQKQSEELMKLYKTHKTNPLSSCFPILAQAPIFFALFTVLNGIGKNPPQARGTFTPELAQQAAEAKFLGAPISEKFNNTDSHSFLNCTNVADNFYNSTSVDGKRNAKDGYKQQYDVATTEDFALSLSNYFCRYRR
jgi:YidC/Oxa1 family membrane protein insertase